MKYLLLLGFLACSTISNAQVKFLLSSKDSVMTGMTNQYNDWIFWHQEKEGFLEPKFDQYVYASKVTKQDELIFTFDKSDICFKITFLGGQMGIPAITSTLNSNYKRQPGDTWTNTDGSILATLKTISLGDIYVLEFINTRYKVITK